jgi:ribonuclease T2
VGLLIPTLFLSQHAVADPSYVLAVSWQPGFCETRPTVPECLNQTPDRYDATHFALHGLWPEPRGNFYCNVPKAEQDQDQRHEWGALPRLRLSAETRRQLEQAMPGTQSHLHRHEWVKHGTCSEMPDPETYYQESLRLLSALNTSPLQRLFADAIGSTLSGEAIRAVIDNAFGEGTGDRMQIVCKAVGPRNLIVALRFNLAGPLTGVDFATALRNASPRDPGCAGGEIDAVE